MPTSSMHTSLTRVRKAFEHNDHLDLSPASNVKLLDLHVTTATDLELAAPMMEAFLKGDEKTFRELEKQRLAAKPDMEALKVELEAMERQRREEELLTPVTRVEVTFDDHFRNKRFWNHTPASVARATRLRAFRRLVETAKAKGFSTEVRTTTFVNGHNQLRTNLKLVFKKFNHHGGLGRTFTWRETP